MTTESRLRIALHEAMAIADMKADQLEICREVRDDWHAQCDDLLTEIERLKKELTYSMMAASAEAERVAELEKEIED